MDLNEKFSGVTASSTNPTIKINTLMEGCRYPITAALRVQTRFGPTVLLTIVSDEREVKVFLPKRYATVITDSDIEDINRAKVKLFLLYQGTCDISKAILLAIEK
jgi:hypothetical protein